MKIKYAKEIAEKHRTNKIVLTASRRTDMPAFYPDEIFEGLRNGVFHPQPLMNPMYKLKFNREDIHSVGLWSQDFSIWIKRRKEISRLGYKFWYRFTILPDNPAIKPHAPPLNNQLAQLESLAKEDGPESISVCIDPILKYTPADEEKIQYNYNNSGIKKIAEVCSSLNIKKITVSIVDLYKKVETRANRYGISLYGPDTTTAEGQKETLRMIKPIADITRKYGIKLLSCCENFLVQSGITEKGACVDGNYLNTVFGPGASVKPDSGQRKKHGCGCTAAVDIGRYINTGKWSHRCYHHCPQCYARR